jgi:DNA-binding transcriptional LysR family regulator
MTETPSLRHLLAVAEIARQGSFRRAADSIHLSQPALTQAVQRLEAELGDALFERGHGGVAPTEAGRLLAARIDRAFAWLKAAERSIAPRAAPIHRLVTNLQLRALTAVVDGGSVSLAAGRLGMAQPGVSRALRDLETLCGRALFARAPHGLEPTGDARTLARYAGLAFAEIRQGMEELRERRGLIDGRIAIGSLPLARTALLPDAVTRLLQVLPGVAVRIVDGPYRELLHALRHGQIDMIVGALRTPSPAADITQEPLFRDPLAIVVRPGHPILGGSAPSLEVLARLDWIVPIEGTPARRNFTDLFAARGVAPPARLIECSSQVAIRGLLLRSDRAALLSASQVEFETSAGQLTVLPMTLPGAEREIGLTTRADWRPTSAQARFLDIIRDTVSIRSEMDPPVRTTGTGLLVGKFAAPTS